MTERALDETRIQQIRGFWRTRRSTNVNVMELKCHVRPADSSANHGSLLGAELPRQIQREHQQSWGRNVDAGNRAGHRRGGRVGALRGLTADESEYSQGASKTCKT